MYVFKRILLFHIIVFVIIYFFISVIFICRYYNICYHHRLALLFIKIILLKKMLKKITL
ncbi:unknown [Gryllus bimaculatus nudivirus]|uniref:Uncharacterized protein n=1 Tax=Gryllus bimaculatus nudivirus TaxID=432587 RepID=A4L255_9VIRU|nr:hypothetical protein GrBNV_gp92 [Gryllus bimaculatus nudivirus]ABO45425.1 unknown [Gryllus bimaculatus nudivirus]